MVTSPRYRALTAPGWTRDPLWTRARMVPSFDIDANFSALPVDRISGQNLTTFTRAASATYVDVDGVIRTAGANVLRRQWDATNQRWGWLVEEARTNLLLRSEEFDNASWTKARCSITQNAIAAPNGSITADLLIEDTSLNTHRLLAAAATVTANSTVTFSVYFKSKERAQIQLNVDEATGAGGAAFSAFFSSSGVSGSSAGGGATYTSGSVQALGDGWYRAVITGTLAGGYTSYRCSIFPAVSGAISYQGDGTSGIYIWGAQLEAGAFPTSYIPTGAATATRDADVWTVTGTNFSRWYRQDEGTIYAANSQAVTTGDVAYSYYLDAGAGIANSIYSDVTTGNRRGVVFVGNSVQCATNFGAVTAGSAVRTAFGLRPNAFGLCADGGSINEDTSGALPSGVARMFIGGNASSSASINGTITRLTYWPARLPNPTLQELTR